MTPETDLSPEAHRPSLIAREMAEAALAGQLDPLHGPHFLTRLAWSELSATPSPDDVALRAALQEALGSEGYYDQLREVPGLPALLARVHEVRTDLETISLYPKFDTVPAPDPDLRESVEAVLLHPTDLYQREGFGPTRDMAAQLWMALFLALNEGDLEAITAVLTAGIRLRTAAFAPFLQPDQVKHNLVVQPALLAELAAALPRARNVLTLLDAEAAQIEASRAAAGFGPRRHASNPLRFLPSGPTEPLLATAAQFLADAHDEAGARLGLLTLEATPDDPLAAAMSHAAWSAQGDLIADAHAAVDVVLRHRAGGPALFRDGQEPVAGYVALSDSDGLSAVACLFDGTLLLVETDAAGATQVACSRELAGAALLEPLDLEALNDPQAAPSPALTAAVRLMQACGIGDRLLDEVVAGRGLRAS